jgi:pyruvate kinase
VQWGSIRFHRQSLKNLGAAMLKTRKICAVMLDTLGREVFVRRSVDEGPNGWPTHGEEVQVPRGGTVTLTTDENAKQSNTVFPVNYASLPGASCWFCLCGRLAQALHSTLPRRMATVADTPRWR